MPETVTQITAPDKQIEAANGAAHAEARSDLMRISVRFRPCVPHPARLTNPARRPRD